MSRSDTFDSDIVEVDVKPAAEGPKLFPWISSPVLQNTTNTSCEALLDPRKLLCESSSIFALIPCRSFTKKADNVSSDKDSSCNKVADVSSQVSHFVEETSLHVESQEQTDLLAEISFSNTTNLLSGEILNAPNSDSVPNVEPLSVIREDSAFVLSDDKTNAGLPAWCFEGDDSFRDVIDAINRLCDTISSGQVNVPSNSEESSFVEHASQEDERITQQPKHKESPQDVAFSSLQYYPSVSEPCQRIISPQQSPESVSTPGGATTDEAILPDSSLADSSSPAVIEDDSSTNQTDILQYSMCSSSLLNDDSGLYLSTESNLPNPEEAPPPGHVAAMRIKFETITNLNTNMVKMLKKSDDDT